MPDASSCTCSECVELCQRSPGWFEPEQAMRAMDAGLVDKIMCDWLEPCSEAGNDNRIFVLAAASVGHGGDSAPEMPMFGFITGWDKGRCMFLEDARCKLHDTDMKPLQCVSNYGCKREGLDNYHMAKLWDSEAGRKAISKWSELTGVAPPKENCEY